MYRVYSYRESENKQSSCAESVAEHTIHALHAVRGCAESVAKHTIHALHAVRAAESVRRVVVCEGGQKKVERWERGYTGGEGVAR